MHSSESCKAEPRGNLLMLTGTVWDELLPFCISKFKNRKWVLSGGRIEVSRREKGCNGDQNDSED